MDNSFSSYQLWGNSPNLFNPNAVCIKSSKKQDLVLVFRLYQFQKSKFTPGSSIEGIHVILSEERYETIQLTSGIFILYLSSKILKNNVDRNNKLRFRATISYSDSREFIGCDAFGSVDDRSGIYEIDFSDKETIYQEFILLKSDPSTNKHTMIKPELFLEATNTNKKLLIHPILIVRGTLQPSIKIGDSTKKLEEVYPNIWITEVMSFSIGDKKLNKSKKPSIVSIRFHNTIGSIPIIIPPSLISVYSPAIIDISLILHKDNSYTLKYLRSMID